MSEESEQQDQIENQESDEPNKLPDPNEGQSFTKGG
jgi:hypothetical protein